MSLILSPAAVETAVPPVPIPVFSSPQLPSISVVPPTAAAPTIFLTPVAPTPATSLSPTVSPPVPDVLFPPLSTPPLISQVTPISPNLPPPSPAATHSPSLANVVFPPTPPMVSAIPPTIFIPPPLPAVVTIPPPSMPQLRKERFRHHSPAVTALPSPVIPTKPAHNSPRKNFPIPVIAKLTPPSSANASTSSPSPPAITLRTPSPATLPFGIPSPPESTVGAQPPPAFSLETQAPVTSPHPFPDKDTTNTPVLPPPPSPTSSASLAVRGEVQNPQPRTSTIPIGITVGLVIGVVFLVMLLVGLVYLCCRYRRTRRKETKPCFDNWKQTSFLSSEGGSNIFLPKSSKELNVIQVLSNCSRSSSAFTTTSLENGNSHPPSLLLGSSCCSFSYNELFAATNGFSEANLLGEGGFGNVFKGVLSNSKEVAVKQLKTGSKQVEREFQAEVETISRVHHRNLVSLVGYCISSTENLLVYEFVPNNTLEFHLHGKGQPVMEWANRMKIAIGSAKGLAYLHEDCNPRIVHRDIKASNILLDCRFEAKLSDFGLAKIFSDTTSCISHVTTRVVGTFGYLAPEYAFSGKVTDKSDVYSYGVMLLELITGRPPISVIESSRNESLVEWARPFIHRALQDGDYNSLVDPRLERNYDTNEMATMVACAAACVRRSARLRPRMSQIVGALEGLVSVTDLQEGITPGHSTIYSWSATSNYDADKYKEDVRNFNMALLSQEGNTSW